MKEIQYIMPEGIGTPLAWLFTSAGEVLRDFDNQPIIKYLNDFDYTYDEEGDDTCDLEFMLPNAKTLDLPYFQQDIVLQVQWGLLLDSGKILKSPTRKIAIRDLKTSYSDKGLKLSLECTDLVAYIKSFKTKTVRSNGKDMNIANAVDRSEDNFMEWLKEVSAGQFTVTLSKNKEVTRLDLLGRSQSAIQDPKTGQYRVAIDNARVQGTIVQELKAGKIIKGKSKSLTRAIEDQLKLQADLENGNGTPIFDSTDNNIHIKYRDYNQPIFKSYTWNNGNGELLKFDSETNTRATSEDSVSSTGVNPHTKKIETTIVEAADTSKDDRNVPEMGIFNPKDFNINEVQNKAKLAKPKPTQETLEKWLEDARETFQHNIENPLNQKELPSLRYIAHKDYTHDPTKGTSPIFVNIPSRQVLNNPDFISLSQRVSGDIRSQYRKAAMLGGHITERIQRKYESTAEVMGDPSLIKGKIVNFTGLGRLDNGNWYITSVSHRISMGKGYICTMDIAKKPKTVNLSAKTYSTNPEYKESDDKVYWPNKVEEELYRTFIANDNELADSSKIDDVDKNYEFKTNDILTGIEGRLDYLNAEEDFIMHKGMPQEPTQLPKNTNTNPENF